MNNDGIGDLEREKGGQVVTTPGYYGSNPNSNPASLINQHRIKKNG